MKTLMGIVLLFAGCAWTQQDNGVSLKVVEEYHGLVTLALAVAESRGADPAKIALIRTAANELSRVIAAYREAKDAGEPFYFSSAELLRIAGTAYLEFAENSD